MTNQEGVIAPLSQHKEHPLPVDAEPATVGNVDYVSDEGVVYGWAWNPAKPGNRVEVELLIDGMAAGTTVARLYREDLQQAVVDDGCYGFSWPLPHKMLVLPHDITLTARIKNTEALLAAPIPFRKKVVANALEKIESLENDIRLLRSTITQLSRREAQDNRAVASLFTTVSDFFAELAAVSAAGESAGRLRPVGSAVADVTSSFAPFAFRPFAAPQISVFVGAAGDVSEIYQTLCALHDSLGDTPAEVCLLDGGISDEASLLPLVAQNLRYTRLAASDSSAAQCNGAMRLAVGDIVVFCAPGLTPAPLWAEALLAAFGETPNLAAVAARVQDHNGMLLSAGATQSGGFSTPRGLGMYPDDAPFTQPCAVEAVGVELFALRRSNWELLGGLNEEFDRLPAALMDFCQRAARADMLVQYQPEFTGVMPA